MYASWRLPGVIVTLFFVAFIILREYYRIFNILLNGFMKEKDIKGKCHSRGKI